MRTSDKGIELIKEFEGLEQTAYPDPGTGGDPWTIGYGHTGTDVYPGLVISKDRAEELLVQDLRRFEDAVETLIDVELNQNEFDALVSFTYNVGEGALGDSTLRRRLNADEDKCPVFQQELPRWVNGGNGPMPGLVRRREAEAKLACTPVIQNEETFLLRAVRYFEEEKHQIDAFNILWDGLTPSARDWFIKTYRAAETPVEADDEDFFPLNVPYFYQRDSKTGNGERMCFTSSMAMALDYIDPETIDGDDDWYLNIVLYFGDTVSSDAQVKAARSLGYNVSFHTDGSQDDLEEILDGGTPVPIGVLHRGSVDHPTGGGHWLCLVGHDDTHFIVHDPFGEMDLINGGYVKTGPTDGKFVRYSKKNLMKRWLIANDHDGWFVHIKK
jgi:GH24 family phage-related lysozyme (muramidase)